MAGFDKEYYQQMIQSDTHDAHWTQFELDLIACIKDEYPIIFTKMGEMTRHQRAGKIRSAWKQISNKFQELPMTLIKARWRSILDNYLKVKIYAGSAAGFNESVVKTKFMDGTLSFLEGEVELFFDHHKTSKSKLTLTNENSSKEASDTEVDTKKYVVDIKDSLHEEVDLDEDVELVQVKEEINDDSVDDDNFDTLREPVSLDNTMDEIKEERKHIWSEEELLNATRLTKEMIDQLILIKTRNYYMAPVVSQ